MNEASLNALAAWLTKAGLAGTSETDIVSPMQHSQLFFSIKSHVDDVRARLAARLAQTRSQVAKVA